MRSYVEVDQTSAIMSDHDKDIKNLEKHRRDGIALPAGGALDPWDKTAKKNLKGLQ